MNIETTAKIFIFIAGILLVLVFGLGLLPIMLVEGLNNWRELRCELRGNYWDILDDRCLAEDENHHWSIFKNY